MFWGEKKERTALAVVGNAFSNIKEKYYQAFFYFNQWGKKTNS